MLLVKYIDIYDRTILKSKGMINIKLWILVNLGQVEEEGL